MRGACLFSWTTDLKHLKSINIHFKRFLSISLLPSSPVSDLAWRSHVYHEIKIKAGNLLVFPSEVQFASSRKAPAEQEFSFHCTVVVQRQQTLVCLLVTVRNMGERGNLKWKIVFIC